MTHNSFGHSSKKVPWKIKSIEDFRLHFRSLSHFRFVENPRIRKFQFSILATRWRQKNIFWLHRRDQKVKISNTTNFHIFPITITLILKTRLRRVETLLLAFHRSYGVMENTWENSITSSLRNRSLPEKINNFSRYANSWRTHCQKPFVDILSQSWET